MLVPSSTTDGSILMNRTSITTLTASVTVSAVAALALGALTPARASGGADRVIRTGVCSAGAHWKLKAKPDDTRIEVEGEVDSNVNGQIWSWRIKHNGSVSAKGTGKTHAPSGSFSVTRRMVDLSGTDSFLFRAVNARSGEVCKGTVAL